MKTGKVLRLGLKNVEANGLGERAALSDSDDITDLDTEGGGQVSGNVGVSLLVTVVLLQVVKVVLSHDDGLVHLGGSNNTAKDASSDAHVTSERALLIDVFSFNGSLRGLEAQAYILVVTNASLRLLGENTSVLVQEDSRLLLKSFLSLRGLHISDLL